MHKNMKTFRSLRSKILDVNINRGCHIWHPNLVRLAPNGTNLGLFKISDSNREKCTETDLKNVPDLSHFGLI